MSKVSQDGFLFIQSSIFDKHQIEKNFNFCIKKLKELNDNITKCDIFINVVENKEGKKFGHTYAWVENLEVFNALIGKEFNGEDRVDYVEDENWSPPTKPFAEAMKEVDGDWGKESVVERMYECPMLEIKKEPLVIPPGIKYTEKQKKELGIDNDFGFIEIFPARVTIRTDENKSNSIYSSCIPEWVTKEMLFKFFKPFTNDNVIHKTKDNKSFSYPKVTLAKNDVKNKWRKDETTMNVHISFSPLDRNIGHFIMNIARKIYLKNPNTGKNEMIFFSQSRTRA